MKTIIKQNLIQLLRTSFLAVLVFLPLQGYALQVDITADPAVPEKAVRDFQSGVSKVEQFYKEYYELDIDYPIKLVLMPDKESYINALVTEIGLSRDDAEKYYYNTTGVSGGHTIVVNNEACSNKAGRVKIIAHELTHQYQASVIGNGYKLRWLSEGTADVMAITILNLNGMASLKAYANDRTAGLQAAPRVPDLRNLRGETDWMREANTTGLGINYYISDEAVIYLIGKVGFSQVFIYFRALGQSRNTYQAFKDAFGMSLSDFEEEFRGHLAEKGIES